jgi:D-glycero-D-manno-heptose 1,7-bisphosphate phosphatase
MNRAVFLDRDGTLNEEVGYVNHASRFQVFPWAAEAVRLINQAGYKVIVLTNQSGVARGLFSDSLVHEVHYKLETELNKQGARLDAIYYCPHHPSGRVAPYCVECDCRKPRPGMVERAQREFDLDLGRCYFVGDRYLDVSLAHTVGARGILVLTGYGLGERDYQQMTWPRQPDHIAEHLLDAVRWIIAHEHSDR